VNCDASNAKLTTFAAGSDFHQSEARHHLQEEASRVLGDEFHGPARLTLQKPNMAATPMTGLPQIMTVHSACLPIQRIVQKSRKTGRHQPVVSVHCKRTLR
jgi:hypothetical protein